MVKAYFHVHLKILHICELFLKSSAIQQLNESVPDVK